MRPAAALLLALGLFGSLAAAETESFHPPFVAYDAQGLLVKDTGRPVSSAQSCMACHDGAFIRSHDLHAKAQVDCLACHAPQGGLPVDRAAYDAQGRLGMARITLRAPADEQCLACHGSGGGPHPLALPQRYLDAAPARGLHPEHLSRESGAVFSGGARRDSRLNLAGKAELEQPWDVHAARLVSCVDCHYAPNKPGRQAQALRAPAHLKQDPRQLSSAGYLRRPDHRLASADCLHCHEPAKGHAFLPYAARHFEKLDCRACHIPAQHAPVLMQEDRALPDAQGRPRQVWRNLEGASGDPINARMVTPFTPWLAAHRGADGRTLIRPVNVVTERAWHGADGAELDFELVQRAHRGLQGGSGLPALRARLQALGIKAPETRTRTRVVPLIHGVQEGSKVLRACLDCHSAGGRLDTPLALGDLADPSDPALPRAGGAGPLSLPGLGRQAWSTRLGSAFFLLTVLAVALHAFWRWRTLRRRRHLGAHPTRRVYLYSAYERFWHWTMAASTLGLVLTGLEIHFNAGFTVLGFALAVKLHNALALLLLANAALSLFHHLSTGAITQFIPRDKDLKGALLAQARYYLVGIFIGAAHPIPKTEGRKLNPLQQLSYLALLNVLLPFQILSGVLIWGAERWPAFSAAIGGLSVILPLHNLGSWLFMGFTLGHIYLTTTGHTLGSNLSAMVDGWDEIEEPAAGGGEDEEEDPRGAD